MTTQAPPRPCLRGGNPAAPQDSMELTAHPMAAASGLEAEAARLRALQPAPEQP